MKRIFSILFVLCAAATIVYARFPGQPPVTQDPIQYSVYDSDTDGLIDAAAGGTELDTSSSTGFPYIDNGAWVIDNVAAHTGRDTSPKLSGNLDMNGYAIDNVSQVEMEYLNGVTSPIQTQIDLRAPLDSPTFTGTVSITDNIIGDNSALIDGFNIPLWVNEYLSLYDAVKTRYDVRLSNCPIADDNTTDVSSYIQAAVDNAVAEGYKIVYLPAGTYRIKNTVTVDASSDLAPIIMGAGKSATKIIVDTGTTVPAFKFTGTTWISHTGLRDMRFDTDDADKGTGVAIQLNCINGAHFENIWIEDVNYGIWLYNNIASRYNENNTFRNIGMANVKNGIRMEQGAGTTSFHGNEFDHVSINLFGTVAAPQIGFNHVSGLYYNGRVNLLMWAAATATYDNSVFIQADGDATTNTGTVTVETLSGGTGAFYGAGRFWWNGWLRTFGTVTDNAGYNSSGAPVIMANNYILSVGHLYESYTTVIRMSEAPYAIWNDGMGAGLFTITKTDDESLLMTGYQSGGETARLWMGTIPYGGQIDNTAPGFSFALDGSEINTQRTAGAVISGADNVWVASWDNSVFRIEDNAKFYIENDQTPATSSEACTKGQITWDNTNIYICVTDNAWMRGAIATW